MKHITQTKSNKDNSGVMVSLLLQVVCWKCSDNKVALQYDGNKLNKVCKACYSILTAQRVERVDSKKKRVLEVSLVCF